MSEARQPGPLRPFLPRRTARGLHRDRVSCAFRAEGDHSRLLRRHGLLLPSGYLITTLLRVEFETSGDIGLKAFYVRRAFRIWPLFYLVLIVATLLTWLGVYGPPLPLDPGLIFMQFAHLANYAIVKAGWYLGRSPESWVYWCSPSRSTSTSCCRSPIWRC